MSTSMFDLKAERANQIFLARKYRDSEALFALADLLAKEDDMEHAETLRQEAKKIDEEDMAFDEARDNGELVVTGEVF